MEYKFEDAFNDYFKEKEQITENQGMKANYAYPELNERKIDTSKPNRPWKPMPDDMGCPDVCPNKPQPQWPNQNTNPNCMIHVVKKGDTLYKIARANGLKVVDLLLANPFVDIYNLRIGEELCVPIKKQHK